MAGDIVLQLRDTRYPGQMEMRLQAADEIERLQEAKRRALAIADERSKENVALRKALQAFAVHATYPVSTEINPRGYAWRGEEALDYAKGLADAALASVVGSMP